MIISLVINERKFHEEMTIYLLYPIVLLIYVSIWLDGRQMDEKYKINQLKSIFSKLCLGWKHKTREQNLQY